MKDFPEPPGSSLSVMVPGEDGYTTSRLEVDEIPDTAAMTTEARPVADDDAPWARPVTIITATAVVRPFTQAPTKRFCNSLRFFKNLAPSRGLVIGLQVSTAVNI